MNQEQIKDFFIRLEHDLTAQKRCFDLVSILLVESEAETSKTVILLTENLKNFELTQKWVSSVKDQFLETKPEEGLSK